MIIKNKTDIDIEINRRVIHPNQEYNTVEMMFNTVDIHSECGSVDITTEYGKRSFRNYGHLFAYEGKDKDNQGLKVIEVSKV